MKILEGFSDVCRQLPFEKIQNMLQVHNEKNCELRYRLATDVSLENPLDWLNDLIDFGVDNHDQRRSILLLLIRTFKNTDSNSDSTQKWVSQLKTRIQVYMGSVFDLELCN